MSSSDQPELLQTLSDAVANLDAAIASALAAAPTLAGHPTCREIPECGELRFTFIVSSLYKLYREAGGEDLKFLNSKIAPSHPDAVNHYNLVNELRTFAQHDVQGDSPDTTRRRGRCTTWFEQCAGLQGATRPAGDAVWNKCIETVLSEAVAYLTTLRSFVDGLKTGMGEYVKREWLSLRTRSIPIGEFDRMAYEIAGDLGMTSLNIVAFRNQYHARIVGDLRAQRFDVDVSAFFRKAITASLLKEYPGVILLSEDLKALGMKPGPALGKALKEGHRIWEASDFMLSKDEVTLKLRERGLLS